MNMKYDIVIDPDNEERVVIYAKEEGAMVERICAFLDTVGVDLIGYRDGTAERLSLGDIDCFTTEGGEVYAVTDHGRMQMRCRLYELEDMVGGGFVRINQSCIVNVERIVRFDASISGALLVIMKTGYRDYVSRRQLKNVKERMGLK